MPWWIKIAKNLNFRINYFLRYNRKTIDFTSYPGDVLKDDHPNCLSIKTLSFYKAGISCYEISRPLIIAALRHYMCYNGLIISKFQKVILGEGGGAAIFKLFI